MLTGITVQEYFKKPPKSGQTLKFLKKISQLRVWHRFLIFILEAMTDKYSGFETSVLETSVLETSVLETLVTEK